MNPDINQNKINLDCDDIGLNPERLQSLHNLGFKLVPLNAEGEPSVPWTPIYEKIDYWKESDFTNLAIIPKFKNVASTAGKTHLRDDQGKELYLNVLDVDSEYISKVLHMSINELLMIYHKTGLNLNRLIKCMSIQGKDKEQINKMSLLEILIALTFVTKTRKPYGFHIWWLSHIQNRSFITADCKKGYEFDLKTDKRGTLCTLPPSTSKKDNTFRYKAVGNTNNILINDELYDLFLQLFSECLLPHLATGTKYVQENTYFESDQDVNEEKQKISKNLIFHTLSNETIKTTLDYLTPYYEEGHRNNFALPFAGTAFHSRLSEDTAISIMEGICDRTNDIDEKKSRINTIKTTYKKGINGIEITGGPTLAELIVKLKNYNHTFARNIVSNLKELWQQDIAKGNKFENGESQQSLKEMSVTHAKRSQYGYVKVKGTIIGLTPVYQMIKSVTLNCTDCGYNDHIEYKIPIFKPPFKDLSRCPSARNKPEHSYNNTVNVEYCYISVIDLELQDLDTYNEIERLSIKIFDKDTYDVIAGEKVTIIGNLHVIRKNDNPNNKPDTVLFAESMEGGNRQGLVLSENDIEIIRKWKYEKEIQGKNPIDELIDLFAPDLIDLDRVKKGMLLVAVSAGLRNNDTRFPKRIRINALLIGNPGLAKTQVLQKTVKLIPNSQYAGGQSSTGLSLTSQISKEDGGSYTLRFGPVVLAKDSVCAINELGQFPMEQQKHLLDCMEENGFPMAKYGFSTTIEAHPSIIASANPINNRWQNNGLVSLNEFPVLPQIIQRFDLIFILRENNNENYLRHYAQKKEIIAKNFVNDEYEGDEEFLKKYVYYCKSLRPVLSQDAQKRINDYYIEMGKVGISGLPRRLDSLMRITVSIAKLKLKSIADEDDAQEAIVFYNEGLDDFNQAVKLSDNPRDIAYQEIKKIVKLNNGLPMSLTEAAEKACENNETIQHYLLKKEDSLNDNNNLIRNKTKKLKLSHNWHLKGVMDLLRKDDDIQIVNEKPIEVRWKDNRKDGALLRNDDSGNIQEFFDSHATTNQCDVYDVYDEVTKIIKKIDNDNQRCKTITTDEKAADSSNISDLTSHQNIINQSYVDQDAHAATSTISGKMGSESKDDRSTSEKGINDYNNDNTNNKLLAKGPGSNINKILPASYTSYTSHSEITGSKIEKIEYIDSMSACDYSQSKTENQILDSAQPNEFPEQLSNTLYSPIPQIKLRHSPKAEIFTNDSEMSTRHTNNLNQDTIRTIQSYRDEVLNSSSMDLEWLPYSGKYEHHKTQIFAAAFCTNWGKRIVLHISNYLLLDKDKPKEKNLYAERDLIKDILFYFDQFPLTFGWYTTGIVVYDEITGDRVKGRDSDFFILHQRCLFYNLDSPFEISHNKAYISLRKGSNTKNKHIDLIKVFEKPIIKESVFEGKYRTTNLDVVSSALLQTSKYENMSAGKTNILKKSLAQQKEYVKRDAELVMMLAQYNNCLVLRLMKSFSAYSELDYFKVCHTNVTKWYKQKYKNMLQRGEGTVDFTPDYKLKKENIAGGHHTIPKKGFFIDSSIYELDVKGMYPTIVMNKNLSFDTLNCTCCKYDNSSHLDKETIDIINQGLKENKVVRTVSRYWTCRKRMGLFPTVLTQVLSDRDKYLDLLNEELSKTNANQYLVEEYKTYQIAAKLFANAGFGLFGNEYFEFSNYQVAECITGEGRRIHKRMEQIAHTGPFNFEIVFGFTDSIFVKVNETNKINANSKKEKIAQYISNCKDELGITVEIKNEFKTSIFYGKKNRFVGWTGKDNQSPLIIKGLDGLAESNPRWVRRWLFNIIEEIIKRPESRLTNVPRILKEAIFELDNVVSKSSNIETELRFIQRLKKDPSEYKEDVRTGKLGRLLDKDKGEEVYWYEITCKDDLTKGNYSYLVPKDLNHLNLMEYKRLLLNKLKDTLEITSFNFKQLELELLQHTLPIEYYS
jgi:DNA replicative helicase MCM subunit Mcm2 (Cdc46/Mcm family)/DNA polymerase elongation subunit (family B)